MIAGREKDEWRSESTTFKRVHYMVLDPLEVCVAPAISPCIFTSPAVVEPLLPEARSN